MAQVNGGVIIARALRAAGIDTVWAVVAGPMIEVLAACEREGIRVVNCRHEVSAGFMASAWGYLLRKPGVLITGSGPGMTNAITPMYVATESGMPLVVLGGSSSSRQRGRGAFQEADQVAFARPACKWATQVDSIERAPEYLHLALGRALNGRPGAVYLDFPANLIGPLVEDGGVRPAPAAPVISRPGPDSGMVDRIARMLSGARRPLLVVGKGAAWAEAGPGLARIVEAGVPYIASPMGRGTLPDDNPLFMNAARSAALSGADVVLAVGSRLNWIFQFGRPPRFAAGVRIAQVDIVAEEFVSAAPVELGLQADAALAAEAIADAMRGTRLASAGGEWVRHLRGEAAKNEASSSEQMTSDSRPINHFRLLREVRDLCTRDTVTVAEGELTMGVARTVLPGFRPRLTLNAGTTGCMGVGLPYALGAKLACPELPVVAVLGDYAFGAAAMEMETAARVGIAVTVVVSNNAGIAGHGIQDRMFAPDAPPIAALLPAAYEKVAEMVGCFGRRVDDAGDIAPAIAAAQASGGPAVINVVTDPKGGMRGSAYLG